MVSSIRPATVPAAPIHERTAPPGAQTSTPVPADQVSLGPGAPASAETVSAESLLPLASRVALAGFAAVALLGGVAGTAHAAQPAPPSISRSAEAAPVRLESKPERVRLVRTYIQDMLEANQMQGENLNTYDKVFMNNWNTLTRLERSILQNPESLNDPAILRTYQKTVAALQSAQIFPDVQEDRIYNAGGTAMTIQTPDGSVITIPKEPFERKFHTRQDYSGAARMTDHSLDSIRKIMK